MNLRRLIATTGSLALVLAAAALPAASAEKSLTVSHMVAPAPPPGVGTMAIYGTLHNEGDAPLVLTGVEAAGFASAMLHETVTTNGIVTMRHRMKVEIGPGETVEFAPGGTHIMLMNPTGAVAPGETIAGVLRLGDGSAVTFEAAVTGKAPMDMHEGHKGHEGMAHKADGAS